MPPPPSRVSSRSSLFVSALIAAGLALTGCGGGKGDGGRRGQQGTPEAGFITAKAETVPLVTELAGRTAAYEVSEVRPQVTGVLKSRAFTEGSLVRAGQTLYQIDPSLYRASAAQAQANLQSARASSQAARERADRFAPLARIEAVSKQDYADAIAQSRQATAAVAQSGAALDTAQINLRFTRVPAPITGRIGRSLFTTGALVTAGQADPLAVIQRLDPMFVDIQQSSAELLALRRTANGATRGSADARLKLEDGSDYPLTGRVQFAEAVVDPTTGTVTLRARFPNPDGLLLPGMFVRAKLTQAVAPNAILVPQPGVSRDPQGNATVLVVGPGDKAVQRKVVTAGTYGDKWIVTGGLKPGERVIVEGLIRVKPGGKIVPVPAGSKPRPQRGGGGSGGGSSSGGGN